MKEAIDSALSQTYPNIEVVVVNDGSTDDTERIALSYGNRIRYFKKENGGVSSALNLGIRNMKGDFFSWLSHDDRYCLDKIEQEVCLLHKINEEKVVALCGGTQIDRNGHPLKSLKKSSFFQDNTLNEWDDSLCQLIRSGSFNGCALLIPKTTFYEVGLFDESLRFCQDFLMWAKILANKYKVAYISKPCVENRVHGGQVTQKGRALFYSDSFAVSKALYDDFRSLGHKKYNFIYLLAMFFARYNCQDALSFLLNRAKKDQTLSFKERFGVSFMRLYGRIRPFVRRMYYRLFRKMKTD